jgi:hypothetical protein
LGSLTSLQGGVQEGVQRGRRRLESAPATKRQLGWILAGLGEDERVLHPRIIAAARKWRGEVRDDLLVRISVTGTTRSACSSSSSVGE